MGLLMGRNSEVRWLVERIGLLGGIEGGSKDLLKAWNGIFSSGELRLWS